MPTIRVRDNPWNGCFKCDGSKMFASITLPSRAGIMQCARKQVDVHSLALSINQNNRSRDQLEPSKHHA